jgi:hypothetical protein
MLRFRRRPSLSPGGFDVHRLAVRTLGTIVLAGLAGFAIAAARTDPPPTVSPSGGFTILSDVALPAFALWASDVRWAGDGSVYLSLEMDGTFEMSLDPAATAPKEIIPGATKPGGFWGSHKLAASPRYLVVAGPYKSLTWRRIDDPARQEEVFESISALDVHDNRLAILGARRDEQQRFAPDGAIAWVGSLDKQLSDLKPLLYDVLGPGAPTMNRCLGRLGAVRFLSDGTFVVVPGVQPGVNLYAESGHLLRTWETAALGIDTDCGSLTEQQSLRLSAHFAEFHAWLNQRRTLDAVVPLPQGPGFIVRKVEKGKTHWDLKVLRPNGTAEGHPVPIEGNGELFHLAADVRSGKMVFLLHETLPRGLGRSLPVPPHLIVAQVPKD